LLNRASRTTAFSLLEGSDVMKLVVWFKNSDEKPTQDEISVFEGDERRLGQTALNSIRNGFLHGVHPHIRIVVVGPSEHAAAERISHNYFAALSEEFALLQSPPSIWEPTTVRR
jgi:hypothetical protein